MPETVDVLWLVSFDSIGITAKYIGRVAAHTAEYNRGGVSGWEDADYDVWGI